MTTNGAYWQLSHDEQAWVRDVVTRHGLPFDRVVDALAEAVRYGAGLSDTEEPHSRDEARHRAAAVYHRGS